jgi:hypothetical protein
MGEASKLGKILAARRNGHRTCVPILGSGLNLQAVRLEGSREDDWAGLLARIARELGLSPRSLDRLPRPHLFRWESMLRLWARVKKIEPFEAELELQKLTCNYLRSLEAAASKYSLYGEFSNARFGDILSLNFDRRVALSFRTPRFNSGPAPCPRGSHGEPLYRHDLLQHADGTETRIWYPHGDTRKFATLKLGVRKYGFYVATIREATFRHEPGYTDNWRFKRGWQQWPPRPAPANVDDRPTYLDPLLGETVIFIGCGLSLDEWPLWSMLRMRAATPIRRRPPAYFVTGGAVSPEQSFTFAHHGIEILSYPSFDRMWDDVRSAIA